MAKHKNSPDHGVGEYLGAGARYRASKEFPQFEEFIQRTMKNAYSYIYLMRARDKNKGEEFWDFEDEIKAVEKEVAEYKSEAQLMKESIKKNLGTDKIYFEKEGELVHIDDLGKDQEEVAEIEEEDYVN